MCVVGCCVGRVRGQGVLSATDPLLSAKTLKLEPVECSSTIFAIQKKP